MKKTLLASVLAVGLVGFVPKDADAQVYTAFLTGHDEVPPVDTPARSLAIFYFVFNDELLLGYRFNFFFGGEDVEMVHIHEAPVGVDGPIVLNLRPEGFCLDIGDFLTIYLATADQLRGRLEGRPLSELKHLMDTGNTYLNLHTVPFPGGWIRGQFPGMGPTPPVRRPTSSARVR